ncbi:hypothetical protein ABZ897_61745 [Nonomuraea sp. NPDC046802]|uniref:hypothetical protein n=1 Tax=Nonomuraea sp. NPDC046802 TaxID=3154919 RepID=UPI003400EC85
MEDKTEPTYEDAPYTEQSLAQLALAATAQDLADFLIGFVAVWPTSEPRPVEDAARFVRRAQELLDRAVIVEKVGGASWEDIGDTLEITKQSAHAKFRQAVEEWEAAVKRPIVTDEIYGIGGLEARTYNRMPAGTSTPDETAAYLDRWALAHADGRDVGGRPVSGGLARMTPLVELMSLSTGALFEEFVVPPPHLLAENAEREAVLWERIAAGGHRTRDAKKHAAAARQRAADLRAQDAHAKSIADVQTPAQHAAEHERRWPREIYGPYRTFPDVASARDWCAHCNVWIGPGEKPSQ